MPSGKLLSPLLAKTLTIGFLTVLLLIPLALLGGLVGERMQLRNQAAAKVAGGWGGAQVVGGPMLNVPFETVTQEGDRWVRTVTVQRILANHLRLSGELLPQLRYVGIYSVPVYTFGMHIEGSFPADALKDLLLESQGRTVLWDKATVFLPIQDPKGIRKVSQARWGDTQLDLQPGHYEDLPGITSAIDLTQLRSGKSQPFSLRLDIAGSSSVRVLPLAATTEVALKSSWDDPSFSGNFAPANYTVSKQGFTANWQVLELNRQFPQQWLGESFGAGVLRDAGFGVDLFQSVDTYHRNERAIKYGILFIALTFMSIFLWEIVTGVRIHAMQYLFVGLGLSVFYLLLLALSEHLPFAGGYSIGASAMALLIGVYLAGALKSSTAGAVAGGVIGGVYALLYLLILSEQYALLLGAILLFAMLATLMLVTRKYDWSSFGGRKEDADD